MKQSDFKGVDPKARERTLAFLKKQNTENAVDALKRAALADNHELYQFEIDNALRYIKAVITDDGEARLGPEE